MKNKQKALVLVQGINEKRYLRKAVRDSGFDLSEYETVIQVKTEKIFDKSIVSRLPFFGDKYGDIWTYFRNETKRKQVSRAVTAAVRKLRKSYATVDVLAHSLGTVITLTSKAAIDTFISLGSPLSFKYFYLGNYVRKHTKKYMKAQIKKIFYLWSPKDTVCNHFDKHVKKLLRRFQTFAVKSKSKHGVLQYIKDLLKKLSF